MRISIINKTSQKCIKKIDYDVLQYGYKLEICVWNNKEYTLRD